MWPHPSLSGPSEPVAQPLEAFRPKVLAVRSHVGTAGRLETAELEAFDTCFGLNTWQVHAFSMHFPSKIGVIEVLDRPKTRDGPAASSLFRCLRRWVFESVSPSFSALLFFLPCLGIALTTSPAFPSAALAFEAFRWLEEEGAPVQAALRLGCARNREANLRHHLRRICQAT